MSQLLIQTAPEHKDYHARNAYFIIIVLMVSILPTAIMFGYLGYINDYPQLYIVPAVLAATFLTDFWLLNLIRNGRHVLAMALAIALFLLDILIVPFFVQGLGPIIAIASIIITTAIAGLAMPAKYTPYGMIVGVASGTTAILLDLMLRVERISIPQLKVYTPYIVIFITGLIFLLILREFRRFRLRIKITFGILITGTIAVTTLTVYGLDRVNLSIEALTTVFEKSTTERVELQIKTMIQMETSLADEFFAKTLTDLNSLAEYRANLEAQKNIVGLGEYWNANEKMYRMPYGQYGNSPSDIASVYIPNKYLVTEEILADLNTTAYLDFIVPSFLKAHPKVVAVYYISALGSTTYYPNIDLAQNIPTGFDPLAQPFYTIAAPQENPERQPRWTPPYKDPAGTGLITTLSIPVYDGSGIFKGVLSADIQISQVAQNLANLKLGETGFSFLLDDKGHILAAPIEGYALFGLQPEDIPLNESPKQSLLGRGSDTLQKVTQLINNGENKLIIENINGVDTYIGFAPLPTPRYRYAIFTPKAELTRTVNASRAQAQQEVDVTLQGVTVLLFILFIGAFLISLWIGQVITNPLAKMVKVVEKMIAGDFSVRTESVAVDETGTLASSFNILAEKLQETLSNLEERVRARTYDLEKANQKNEYRATQFESIALVARTISTTQTMEDLLTQITETISRQFNFYHVGIFLLDNHREYAILVAANSAGGKRMLQRNHRLRVGETGIVGYVTNTGQPRVALDVGMDATYFNNPDLPNTHSEMALPLQIGADIFGALDVQSMERNAFSEEDISVLSILADQVSIAIQNARSYQQSREALIQAEDASSRLSGQHWRAFVEHQTVKGYYYDGVNTKSLTKANQVQSSYNLSIPLTLRGIHIGNIKLNTLNPNHEWTDDEISIVQSAAERTSLALENARLLQESQRRAAKERAIGEISAKIGSSVNLENILQTTIQELGNALPGTDIAIQFTDTTTSK